MTDKVTLQDIQATGERVKNWGRWGADDEVGTLNNIYGYHQRGAHSSAKGKCFRWR